jgi:hypothetical protein
VLETRVLDLGYVFLDLLVWYTEGYGAVDALREAKSHQCPIEPDKVTNEVRKHLNTFE